MRNILLTTGTVLLGVLVGCSGTKGEAETYSPEEIAAASARANAYFDACFDAGVDRSPMTQTYLAIKTDYGKWDDLSPESEDRELAIAKKELQYALDSIQPEALDAQARISYKLFVEDRQHQIADDKWRDYTYPVNQMFGWHSQIPSFLINMHQVSDSSDAAAYISRLQGVEALMAQLIKNLKRSEDAGITPPKFVYPRVISDSRNILTGAPFTKGEASAIYADFKGKVEKLALSASTQKALLAEAEKALLTSVQPGYEYLISFLEEQETRATTEDGCWKFPEGDAFYETRLKRITTTDMTAEEIHQIGLAEVDRIHNEMREIMKEVEFEGDLKAFFTFLKEDAQFYYPNTDEGKEEYLDSAKQIIDNMRARLDDIFITQPKAEIMVKRVEAFREKSAGKAFYNVGAPDGSRPGVYYANLADTKNMPTFEMEALAYHEGIPGHHMDRSIAQELTEIPKFRKYAGYTAYVEGWGLYSEYLPREMGFYANPYSNYGRLAMELWRACRLVVDTGIHLKKWSREDGIAYYQENTSGSDRECVRMVERHIVMPAQATAYKIGMLKILELRAKAKNAMGDQFDLKEFHEVVLTNGAVPLSVLEELVDEYIASKPQA